MNFLLRLIGLGLTLWGIYILGENIFFTTQTSPYFWRGIAADASILTLTMGVLMLVLLPRNSKTWGLLPVVLAIVLVIASGRAVLQPTSLWQLFLSLLSLTAGYTLLTTGRIPL